MLVLRSGLLGVARSLPFQLIGSTPKRVEAKRVA